MTKVKSRKDIIKNIAIVFLAVMLVLTFFSNTIMNFSLSEVNGRYTEYGSIRTGVRGSGMVEANTVFEQSVKGDQRVTEVYVREGDRVVEGQLLMKLEPSVVADNTAEIEALEEQLEGLIESYERAMLSRDAESDYTLTEMDIEAAREELDALKEKRAQLTDEEILAIETEYAESEKAVEDLTESIELLEEQINDVSAKSDDATITAARKQVEDSEAALKKAEEELENAEEALANASYTDTESLKSQLESIERSLKKLKDQYDALEYENRNILDLESIYDNAKEKYFPAVALYEYKYGVFDPERPPRPVNDDDTVDITHVRDWEDVKTLYKRYIDAKTEYEENLDAIKSFNSQAKAIEEQQNDIQYEYDKLNEQMTKSEAENDTYNKCKESVKTARANLQSCNKALENAKEKLEKAVEGIAEDLTLQLKKERASLKSAEKRFEEASEKMTEAENVEELDSQIAAKERSVFEMEYNLNKQKESDKKADELEEYDFKKQKAEIDELRAKINKLKGNTLEGETEFVSRYNGTVTAFTCRVGDVLSDGMSVVSIESEESGYTLSFTVSNADARKLQIGDSATVTGGYWGGRIEAVLSTLKTQPGGQSKLATFDLSGDVVSGQTLTLIAGEKSTSYSSVVPKSAIREDSDGKYIYITKTKSTPLGNRYVATRLPVEIVASDDVNAAITSSEQSYIYEFAITSSTKPIADGDYVRLAD